MKILANFDRAIAEALQEKVKARLTFKVGTSPPRSVLDVVTCVTPRCSVFGHIEVLSWR
jgi:hypothetical protein